MGRPAHSFAASDLEPKLSGSLEREIERRRRRAVKLGVDRLICGLYFDHGLCHYVSWSKQPEYRYNCITEVSQPDRTRLDITLFGQAYSIRTTNKDPYPGNEDVEVVELELFQGDVLLFGQRVGVINDEYSTIHMPRWITAFVEGGWIDHFRALETEVLEVEARNRRRSSEKHAAQEAERFGIAPAKESFVASDISDWLQTAARAVVATPFVLVAGLLRILVPFLIVLGLIGLLLLGFKQLF